MFTGRMLDLADAQPTVWSRRASGTSDGGGDGDGGAPVLEVVVACRVKRRLDAEVLEQCGSSEQRAPLSHRLTVADQQPVNRLLRVEHQHVARQTVQVFRSTHASSSSHVE